MNLPVLSVTLGHMRACDKSVRIVVKVICCKQRERDERCRTRHKESRQNTGETATIFETIPAGGKLPCGIRYCHRCNEECPDNPFHRMNSFFVSYACSAHG